MNKLKTIFAAVGVTSMLVLSPLAIAEGPQGAEYSGKMLKMMAKKLDLTDAQQDAFKALKEKNKSEKDLYKEQMKQYKAEMKGLMDADEFNEQDFASLRLKYQDTLEGVALLKAKSKFEMKNILTEEQLEKFKKMKKRMGKKHRGRHGESE